MTPCVLGKVPETYVFATSNPASYDGKGGIRVTQLVTPTQQGRVTVHCGSGDGTPTHVVSTQNVNELEL